MLAELTKSTEDGCVSYDRNDSVTQFIMQANANQIIVLYQYSSILCLI